MAAGPVAGEQPRAAFGVGGAQVGPDGEVIAESLREWLGNRRWFRAQQDEEVGLSLITDGDHVIQDQPPYTLTERNRTSVQPTCIGVDSGWG